MGRRAKTEETCSSSSRRGRTGRESKEMRNDKNERKKKGGHQKEGEKVKECCVCILRYSFLFGDEKKKRKYLRRVVKLFWCGSIRRDNMCNHHIFVVVLVRASIVFSPLLLIRYSSSWTFSGAYYMQMGPRCLYFIFPLLFFVFFFLFCFLFSCLAHSIDWLKIISHSSPWLYMDTPPQQHWMHIFYNASSYYRILLTPWIWLLLLVSWYVSYTYAKLSRFSNNITHFPFRFFIFQYFFFQ